MTRADVISSLASCGFFRGRWELDDDAYDPISVAFVRQAWSAWVASLPPQLREMREIGGGKRDWFPKWTADVFDCDDIAIQFAAFLELCMAVDAVKLGKPRGSAARGRFNFSLNGNPTSNHCRNWFIDYDGKAHGFDAGNALLDGESVAEKETIFFGESL